MSRRPHWHSVFLLSLAAACTRSAPSRTGPPNVLILYVDDMGYADLGCTGNASRPTPNIDALAAESVSFRSAYSTACVCSPARAALLTGRYPQRFGFETNVDDDPRPEQGLDPAARTLADRFKALGYTTGLVGKWHVGLTLPEHLPNARGFDEFYGILSHEIASRDDKPVPLWRNGERLPAPENHMLAFGEYAQDFIARHADAPWLLYCAFTAVHVPYEFPPELREPFLKAPRPGHQAMLALLDGVVGDVLAELGEQGLEENTLVFFASDNGGARTFGDNGPYAGHKHDLGEGGIRTPLFVRWTGQLPGGVEREGLVTQLDVLPTALAAAGVAPPPDWELDGADLLPLARGASTAALHPALFWRFGVQFAVREGPWKLVKTGLDEPVRLFDVERDPGERDDRIAAEPERAAALRALWERWNADNRPPRWEDSSWNGPAKPPPPRGSQ